MKHKKNDQQIGIKTKVSVIFIFGYIVFLTWLIIISNFSLKVQFICFLITIITSYILLVLIQDYFYLKSHKICSNFRKDINLIRPLFSERVKKK